MIFSKIASEEKSLQDHIPILRIEKDVVILKDGRVGKGFLIQGANFESLHASEYENFCKMYEAALGALPQDYIVQKVDVFHNAYYPNGRSDKKETTFFERQTLNYFASRAVLRQESYLFIISNNITNKKRNPFSTTFSLGSQLLGKDFKGIEKRVEEIKINAKSFCETISSTSSVSYKELTAEELEIVYGQFLNVDFRNKNSRPEKGFYNHENSLIVGEKKVNIISLQEQGDELFYSVPNHLGIDSPFTWPFGIYLQFPHLTVTSWYVDNTEKELRNLDSQKRQNNTLKKLGGQSAIAKAEELEEFTLQIRKEQSKLCSVSFQVVLFTANDTLREKNIQETCDAFRSLYGAKPLVETFDNANLFFSCLPFGASNSLRWILMRIDMASCYANFTSEFLSARDGDYVCDRFRNLVYINLFDRQLNNQNSIVIGPSGSGKSFTMGHFILQRFERKQRQIIIDVGGTYKNLVDILEGKYFEYNPENPISFNPFITDKIHGKYRVTDEKVGFIIGLLTLLWKPSGTKLSNVEWSLMQDLIPRFYTQHEASSSEIPTLTHFAAFLVDFKSQLKSDASLSDKFSRFDISELSICLEPFVTGRYKALLNSKEVLDISAYPLVCFDLARIKEDIRLYPIVTMLLTELTLDTIRKFPDEVKYFTMDEAWSMLSDAMGDFVQNMYRTVRKNNGSITIISQDVDVIVKSSIGKAIINNAETKIILNHTDQTLIEELGIHLGFTKEDLGKIYSLRVNPDCREVFIKQGGTSFVFVIEAPPSEYAVVTSNPVERNHLVRLKSFYKGNIEFAVKQWEEDKLNKAIV
ncbi:MAG: TraG family conjugative transposon ATPase [Bacteroidetes bacterium]|nr:TraG family conjugative transposon ATPase [Bacteroidota bacterium]